VTFDNLNKFKGLTMNKNISEKERTELLTHYLGEKRKLTIQLDFIRQIIDDLQVNTKSDDINPIQKKGRGRPRKNQSGLGLSPTRASDGTQVKRGPGRPKLTEEEKAARRAAKGQSSTKKERKERALNQLDQLVIEAITSSDKFKTSKELLTEALGSNAGTEPKALSIKLAASLQKLTKKGLLRKHHSGIGRGDHYGLDVWFDSTGKLTEEGRDKLVVRTKRDMLEASEG
jgi:hypothetical protein